MQGCNLPTQSEVGGKNLHLKICILFTFGSVTTNNQLTATGHGAKINDIVKFNTLAANTVITTTDYYYVVAIVDANKIEISNTKGGTPIVFDATGAPTGEIYESVGGIQSKEFAFAGEAIDISSQDSDEWKTTLDEAGMRSVSVSGSGAFGPSNAFTILEQNILANKITELMFIDLKNFKGYVGFFKITQLSLSGDFNDAGKYSFSAESAGAITVIPVI